MAAPLHEPHARAAQDRKLDYVSFKRRVRHPFAINGEVPSRTWDDYSNDEEEEPVRNNCRFSF